MPAQGGVKFVLQTPATQAVANGVSAPQDSDYSTAGGFQSNSMDFTVSLIDVTEKGSDENRTILNERGIKSTSISGEGFLENTQLAKDLETNLFNQKLRWFRMVRDDGATFTGLFKITAYNLSGSYDDALNFSFTLESSGEVVVDHT